MTKITIVAIACLLLTLPAWCAAGQGAPLQIGTLVGMASGVTPVLYAIMALFILLICANVANAVTIWHLLPAQAEQTLLSHLKAADFEAIRSLATTAPANPVFESLCAGIHRNDAGRPCLDKPAVLAAFETLNQKYLLLPAALKAFGVIVLLFTLWAVGADLIRLYLELYERLSVVVGNYPFRKIFQMGSARIMVLGLGGLSVAVASIAGGYLFSGAMRFLQTRRASRLVKVLSESKTA